MRNVKLKAVLRQIITDEKGERMNCKEYRFSIEQNAIPMDSFIRRFHFDEKDRELLVATERFLVEMITIEAGIQYREDGTVSVVTLGKRFDELSNLVAESGNLLLAYSMECFAMEFLSKSYEKMNEMVFRETGKWMGEYHFWGTDNSEEIRRILEAFQNLFITQTDGMLRPLKSVIFAADYKEKKEESGCHNCEQCNNVTCSFRNIIKKQNPKRKPGYPTSSKGAVYSYGISRIMGHDRKE